MALFRNKRRMGDILRAENIVTEEQIVEALPIAREQGKKLGEMLVELGYTTRESVANALSRQLNMEMISLSGARISGDSETMQAAQRYAKEREFMKSQMAEEDRQASEEIDNSPIVQLVRSLIEQGAGQRASGIHIEALETKVRVRYHIDGAL